MKNKIVRRIELSCWIVCGAVAFGGAACTRQGAHPVSNEPPKDLVQPLIDKEKENRKATEKPNDAPEPSPNGTEKGPTKEDVEKANNTIIKSTLARMKAPAKPKTEGWVATAITLPELGAKLDESIGSMKDTVGKFDLYVKSKKLTGSVASRLQVVDKGKFSIEYYSPTKPVESVRIVANGQVKAVYSKAGWEKRKPEDAPQVMLPNAELIQKWMKDFPEWSFGSLTDDQKTWRALLKALSGPDSGFKTTVEQRTMKVNGDKKLFYRILTTSTKDKDFLIEIRVDAKRMLPVSIIVNQNPETSAQWFASYGFHQPMKEESFQIPSNF